MLMLLQSLSSASSTHSREELPPGMSNAVPPPSDPLPMASPRNEPPEEIVHTAKSSQGISTLKRLLSTWIGKSNMDPASHKADRVPGKSRRAIDHQSHSHSSAKVEDSDVGLSRMAATKRVPVSALP